ncbi:MAG: DUF1553 domain-containing protein, partial [Planctomycetes bacterium]|nr:DUF1553 domain-containing protein [Planctomycetota bacterium]
NFGVKGEPPSHPELLDWLAAELVESGWSTKHIHRQILLSETYCQSSETPASLAPQPVPVPEARPAAGDAEAVRRPVRSGRELLGPAHVDDRPADAVCAQRRVSARSGQSPRRPYPG